MHTLTESRWVSDNYITRCHRRLESSRGCSVPVAVGGIWEPAPDRAWTLSDPRLTSPARMKKECCYGQKNFGSICGSLSPSPTHLSHITNINPFATLSRIKCERYIYILKKCVRSFIEVVIIFLLTSACIWVCNKIVNSQKRVNSFFFLNLCHFSHWELKIWFVLFGIWTPSYFRLSSVTWHVLANQRTAFSEKSLV